MKITPWDWLDADEWEPAIGIGEVAIRHREPGSLAVGPVLAVVGSVLDAFNFLRSCETRRHCWLTLRVKEDEWITVDETDATRLLPSARPTEPKVSVRLSRVFSEN